MHAKAPTLLLAIALLAGCTTLGESTRRGLAVEDETLLPFEARVRVTHHGAAPVRLEPEDFHLRGADGAVFPGWPSAREGALGATPLSPGASVAGWVAFRVDARAVAPLTLVVETEGGGREEVGLAYGV